MPAEHSISALEWELLAFFEAEPTVLDRDVAWPYNSFEYRTRSGDFDVMFSVAPSYKDFTLSVHHQARKHLEWTFLDVHDIRYHPSPDERLTLYITPALVWELRLRPSFSLLGGNRPQA